MSEDSNRQTQISTGPRSLSHQIRRWDVPVLFLGLSMIILQYGMMRSSIGMLPACVTLFAMLFRVLVVGLMAGDAESLSDFWQRNRRPCLVTGGWSLTAGIVLALGPVLPLWHDATRFQSIVALSEFFLLVSGASRLLGVVSRVTHRMNPAVVFVSSFAGLILLGTFLLLLPGSHSEAGSQLSFLDQCRVALFTSTSASCVTGLVVVPTGGEHAHWSRFGQVVILILIQLGGLGIMSLSAVFALLGGRQLGIRESAALSEMTETLSPRDVRALMLSIIGLTATCEIIGALLMSSLWQNLPFEERAFLGLFHSISAFCNAGFTLTENSYVGMGALWQVWMVTPVLIILGGLGFGTISSFGRAMRSHVADFRNSSRLFRRRKFLERLNLSSRLACTVTVALLVGGMIGYWLLEANGVHAGDSFGERLSEAWFQSVTFRTAGFNTVDHATLHPGTKLFAVGLMFIGASPGSTGGGIKTLSFAVLVCSLRSLLRGRRQVEVDGRSIPEDQVRQALAIMFMALITIMVTTLTLVVLERNEGAFLNHLFEATSAFATVGVSAGVTPGLSGASQLVLVLTMFLGRVGPLTVLFALTRQSNAIYYQYPEERIVLG